MRALLDAGAVLSRTPDPKSRAECPRNDANCNQMRTDLELELDHAHAALERRQKEAALWAPCTAVLIMSAGP